MPRVTSSSPDPSSATHGPALATPVSVRVRHRQAGGDILTETSIF